MRTCPHCSRQFDTAGAFNNHTPRCPFQFTAANTAKSGAALPLREAGVDAFNAAEYPAELLHREAAGGDDGDDSDAAADAAHTLAPPPAPSVTLDVIMARLADFCENGCGGVGLSLADQRTLIGLLRDVKACTAITVEDLPRGTRDMDREVHAIMARFPDLEWHYFPVTAPSFPHVAAVTITVRDLKLKLQADMARMDLKYGTHITPPTSGNLKRYDHPMGAEYIHTVERMLHGMFPSADVLALQGWSDKGNLNKRGSLSGYPFVIVPMNCDYNEYREAYGEGVVAYLPILDQATKLSDEDWTLYRCELMTECFRIILRPILDCETEGGYLWKDKGGSLRHIFPIMHTWVADNEEKWAICNCLKYRCHMCEESPDTLLPMREQTPAPLRNEDAIRIACKQLERLRATGTKTAYAEAKTKAGLHGVVPITCEFPYRHETCPNVMLPSEQLHDDDSGVWPTAILAPATRHLKRLYGATVSEWLTRSIGLRLKMLLEQSWLPDKDFPSVKYYLGGKKSKRKGGDTNAAKVQCSEHRAMMQILPLVLTGILPVAKPEADYLTDIVMTYVLWYMEKYRRNRPPGYTDEVFQQLNLLGTKLLNLLTTHFSDDQPSDFQTMKMHMSFGPHFEQCVREYGDPAYYNANWGEHSLQKVAIKPYSASNKQTGTVIKQMAENYSRGIAAARAMKDAGLTAAPPGLGTRDTAERLAMASGVSTLAVTSSRVALEGIENNLELAGREGLYLLGPMLLTHFATHGASLPTHINVSSHACIVARLPHQPIELDVRINHIVRALPQFYGKRRMDRIMVEGVENAKKVEWYCEIQLLFNAGDQSFALVKWFAVDKERAAIPSPLYAVAPPLVWERRGAHAKRYSFDVIRLEEITCRVHIVPDLCDVFAPNRPRKAGKGKGKAPERAKARRRRDAWSSDDSESEPEPVSDSDGDDDTPHVTAKWPLSRAADATERFLLNPLDWSHEPRELFQSVA